MNRPETSHVDAQLESLKELWLTENDLSPLRAAPPEVLDLLQREVAAHAARVAESERGIYEAMAKFTRYVPNFVLARVGAILSPYSTARVAALLEAKHAAGLAKTFEPAFLGEVALHLDAQTAGEIARHTDIETLSKINESLMRKGLYRRLAELSDALEEPMLAKLAQRMRDPEAIATVASQMRVVAKAVAVARHLERPVLNAVKEALRRKGATGLLEAIA